MVTPLQSLRVVEDPALPGLESLIGTARPPALAAVLESAGSRLIEAIPIQVLWAPGRQMTVRYRVRSAGGHLRGKREVVATIGSIPEGSLRVNGPASDVGVWVVPNDPLLPGLASALDERTVDDLLIGLGVRAGVRSLRLRSYRPGRRGVVEARSAGGAIFLKVVPVSEAKMLHSNHRALAGSLPVPDSLGVSIELGIVVMTALPGVDLRTALRSSRARLPGPLEVSALIEDLPSPPTGQTARSPLERVPGALRILSRIVPDQAERLERLGSAIGPETQPPSVPVHGDFHEAQIMVEDGRPVGLIDIDTYGTGRPGDDPATMLGHLSLLSRSAKDLQRVLGMARALNRIWDGLVDPVDLRRRVAATVLGMAVGPFRVLRPNWPDEVRTRIVAAERWADSARRVDERGLIRASEFSQVDTGS